ncbi:hypothetical protein BAE44_0001291 [Dichanthelium oligosanthes]|uniref:RING-type domain-containing protein n=1 Tax=Dichanthelium oligosanthes TaxID=888268 RepID=A0A1E5WKM5_9POAL|nr:hypothetical protein BAE44_0001291 [Dichanthelium oligosanthes]
MPIASKLIYFQRRPPPAPPDPGPEPPDPRRRASRDPSSGRQRHRGSHSYCHYKPARERLLQRLNSVDLSGRRQKTCPSSETIWAGLARPADFSSDCILGTLTNCFQPGESTAASKVEGTAECVSSDADERTPISLFPEPFPGLHRSACSGGAEEGDDRSSEPPAAECSICLERCGGTDDGLTQLRCRHVFHSACLERWLRSRGDCPYCRAAVLRS